MTKKNKNFKYIYGPVGSWRIGSSLGVDLLSGGGKICNFDCAYCQLGKTLRFTVERKKFVPLKEILREIHSLPADIEVDYITFSGMGEPTLAANLGEVAEEIRKIRKEPLAILTNSANLGLEETLNVVSKIDFVIAKLDAFDEKTFRKINNPAPGIRFDEVLLGIRKARERHNGRFAIQTMLTADNYSFPEVFADLYREIIPDEIQLNTPLRPSKMPPLCREEILSFAQSIRQLLPKIVVKTVYEEEKPKTLPISAPETMLRRGKIL